MNNLTKAQVLALFLGVSKASTVLESLNGAAAAYDPPFTNDGGECNALGGCDGDKQRCGNLVLTDGDTVATCVNEFTCGSLGRLGGKAFMVDCWTAVAEGETPVAPTASPAAQYMTDIESLITKTTINWDGIDDIWVSSAFNWQDGWFTKDSDGAWTETDKPADNRCFLDLQCESTECCALYPDSNNRRCIDRTGHNQMLTVGPVSFTPTCPSITTSDDPEPEPENAKDDIAAGALSEARGDATKWLDSLLEDAKKEAGYDDADKCDQACQDKFDADWKAQQDKEDEFAAEMMKIADPDGTFDDAAMAIYVAKNLEWLKATYTACKDDALAIACVEAETIYRDVITARGTAYYTGTAEERAARDTAEKDEIAQQEASLLALALENNKPAAGALGGACGDQTDGTKVKCAAAEHCCADFSKDGVKEFIGCADDTLKWANVVGQEYTAVCILGATKIASTVAAAGLALYYM